MKNRLCIVVVVTGFAFGSLAQASSSSYSSSPASSTSTSSSATSTSVSSASSESSATSSSVNLCYCPISGYSERTGIFSTITQDNVQFGTTMGCDSYKIGSLLCYQEYAQIAGIGNYQGVVNGKDKWGPDACRTQTPDDHGTPITIKKCSGM